MYPAYRHVMARDPGAEGPHVRQGVRPGRKVGHVNVCGDDLDDVRERARHAAAYLRGDDRPSERPATPSRTRWSASSWASDSDWPVMEAAAQALEEFGIPYEVDVVSAHRMPDEMIAYGAAGRRARPAGRSSPGAGGAAHLPGMLASVTPLPVIGVPVPLKYLDGMDSLLSIVQMPAGVPVATVSVGGRPHVR